VAIPAMSWVFVPTILLAIATGSDTVLHLAAWMHDVGWPWLAVAGDVPWALAHANPPLWWYAVASVCILISLLPLPIGLRIASLIGVLPLAASIDAVPGNDTAEITILDVGEGTAVVVQTAHHTLVYDTGDVYGTEGRTAETVLIPFLRSRGVHQIDKLVLSRVTPAGAPGVTALLAELPVTQILAGGPSEPDLESARSCDDELAWRWDNVSFRTSASTTKVCVLTVESGGGIRALMSTSTSEFTNALGAHWVVVSGRRERNGREKAAIGRWRASGATVLATADTGAIRFRIDAAQGLAGPMAYRADNRTLWRASP
jgi:competence protein ComEC